MDHKQPEQNPNPALDLDGPDLPDAPLDLEGFETMTRTFGEGVGARVVLVSKPITINQLIAESK